MRTFLLRVSSVLLALSACTGVVAGQIDMHASGDGGAVPGKTTLELSGTPNMPFLLLFSEKEMQHQPLPGVQLEIDLTFLPFCISNSALFVGSFDGSGDASRTIPVPNLPGLYGARMSMQALELNPIGNVSNLVRVTLQKPETFAATQGKAAAPILTGQGFVQADGKVLLLGGSGPVVQEYDPDLETFRIAAVVPSGNVLATQTALKGGTVLVTGGIGAAGQPVKSAFLFDPPTGKSTALPDMSVARAGHAAALLNDGRVLVVGGAKSLDFANLSTFLAGIQNGSEFFDPKTRTFKAGPALLEQKMFHSATTLSNGEVLVAGGLSVVPIANVPIVSPTAQAYTPSISRFGLPKLMASARMLHGATALGNGQALLAGGLTIDFTKFLQTGNLADLAIGSVADAVTYSGGLFGGFSKPYPLTAGRLLPAVAPLGTSGALIAGGFKLNLSSTKFDFLALPATDRFDGSKVVATGSLITARYGAVAVPLPDGSVLVTGGGTLDSEIFQPK